jgi:methionine-rich copper-binding protein CopC
MTTTNFFFIDARVQNYQAFVSGLQSTDAWVLLNADEDGLDQMVRALSGVSGLASIQIISHGAQASLSLGSTQLNLETVQGYQDRLAAIGASLSAQGDIQLYGCNVAQGQEGELLVQAIAQLTQADVAASTDLTGASAEGGNWTLEYAVGQVNTSVLVPVNYDNTLDTITGDSSANNLTGTSGNDTINGYTVTVADGKATTTATLNVNLTGANDAPTGSVTISGTAKQGQTLTVANTLADAEGLGTISYQWKADGVNISGATTSTLTLAQAQVGKAITVSASYTDLGGTAESVTSVATAAVTSNASTSLQLGTVSGVNLSLISPVTLTNGKKYYIVDLNKDGVITSDDHISHVTLDQLFNNGNDRTDTQASGAVAGVDDARTVIVNGYTLVNPTTTELIAIRTEKANVLPTGWHDTNYATATLVSSNVHHNVSFTTNTIYTNLNDTVYPGAFVVQVLGTGNNSPTGSVTISGTAKQGQTLTAANTLVDTDGLGTISYQWKADGVNISGANTSTLTLAQAQVGKAITVSASYTDLGGTAESVTSVATAAVTSNASTSLQLGTVSGVNLSLISPVTLANGKKYYIVDLNKDGVITSDDHISHVTLDQLFNNGNDRTDTQASGAVAGVDDARTVIVNGYTLVNPTTTELIAIRTEKANVLPTGWHDANYATATLVSSNVHHNVSFTTNTIYTNLNDTVYPGAFVVQVLGTGNNSPTGSVTISGTAKQGQTLTAANTLVDTDGLGTISYQWKADGVNISGANTSTLTLAQAQVGKAITVSASYTDLGGTAESVTSVATAAVTSNASTSLQLGTVSGVNLSLISPVTLANGKKYYIVDLNKDGVITSDDHISHVTLDQLFNNGNDRTDTQASGAVAGVDDARTVIVNGYTLVNPTTTELIAIRTEKANVLPTGWHDANYATATLVSSNVHHNVSFTTNTIYTNLNDTVYPGAFVVQVLGTGNNSPTGSVTISGTAKQGQTLTAANTLVDTDGLGTISYQWKADGVNISGANTSTLTLAQAQVGKAITVSASYTDLGGTAESVTSVATAAVTSNASTSLQLGTVSGVNLSLISPVTLANGKKYYIVDLNKDGVITSDDHISHVTLDQLFNNGNDRTDTQASGAVAGVDDARTVIVNGYTLVNPTTTELIAIRTEKANVLPTGWHDSNYATATLVSSNVHHNVGFTTNITYTNLNDTVYPGLFVVQVLGTGNNSPTGSVTISGTAKQGQTLTAANTLADADGLGTISYQWKADGVNISGATTSTLTLGQTDAGKSITVVASYTDLGGTAESVSSAATVVSGYTLGQAVIDLGDQGKLINPVQVDGGKWFYQWDRSGNGSITFSDSGPYNGGVDHTSTAVLSVFFNRDINGVLSPDGLASEVYRYSTVNGVKLALPTLGVATATPLTTTNVFFNGTSVGASPSATGTNAANTTYDGLLSVWDAYNGTGTGQNIYGTPASWVTPTHNDFLTATRTESGYAIFGLSSGNASQFAYSSSYVALEVLAIDTTAPTVTSFSPVDEATGVAIGANIEVTFSESVQLGTGNIVLKTGAGVTVATYAVATSTNLSIVGNKLTINPSADLNSSTDYKLEFAAGSIKDIAGNNYAGSTTYNFTTAAAAPLAKLELGTVSGVNLSLISPVTLANGKKYYIVDLNKDGVITSDDHISHVTLDQLFNNGNDRTDTQASGAVAGVDDARTVIVNGYTLVNPTTTELVAIRTEKVNVLPTGWHDSNYATATLVSSNVHHNVSFTTNTIYTNLNDTVYPGLFVVQVLGTGNNSPTGSVTISGTAKQGQTLTAANTLADADGLGTISYQWKADGVNISGATGTTLALAQAHVGKAITVTASYTDLGSTAESVTSSATTEVANLNDAPTGSVTISGTAKQGQTLTAANTLADTDGLGTISYQWRADGVNISGATNTTLTLEQAHVGKVITVVASYTDLGGAAESVTSGSTAAVTPSIITGTQYGDTLVGTSGNDTIYGLGGEDEIAPGAGNDFVDGGESTIANLVSYRSATAGVVVNLVTGVALDGQGGTDTLVNISDVDGSEFNDQLTINRWGFAYGAAGNDTITSAYGFGGMAGGPGNDLLIGTRLPDFAGYQIESLTDSNLSLVKESSSWVVKVGGINFLRYTPDFVNQQWTVSDLRPSSTSEFQGVDSLREIDLIGIFGTTINGYQPEAFFSLSLSGSAANVQVVSAILGDSTNETLTGGSGDDLIIGAEGGDTLVGGAGNDTLVGGDQRQFTWLNDGKASYYFYNDYDIASYTNVTAEGVKLNLSNMTVMGLSQSNAQVGVDTLRGIEEVRLSYQSDVIVGTLGNLSGNNEAAGDQHGVNILGYGGSDKFTASQEVNTPWVNSPYLNYNWSATAIELKVSGYAGTVTYGATANQAAGVDTIEYISSFGDTSNSDTFDFSGMTANHLLGTTFNYVNLSYGNDKVIGNGNTAVGLLNGFNVTSSTGKGVNVQMLKDGAAFTVDMSHLSVNGTQALGIKTLSGIDQIRGTDFADTMVGGAYDDFEGFRGRGGDDFINGASGVDRSDYLGSYLGVRVNMAQGTAWAIDSFTDKRAAGSTEPMATGTVVTGYPAVYTVKNNLGFNVTDNIGSDTLRSIERIRGTQFDDYYDARGFSGTSTNAGSNGAWNEFEGKGGNDTIVGNGATRISYYDSSEGVEVNMGTGKAWALDPANRVGDLAQIVGQDTFSGVYHVVGSALADSLVGGGAGRIVGDLSLEAFTGGAGNDTIDGVSGWDEAYYSDATSAIKVDMSLATGQVQDGMGGTDTLVNIDAVGGSDFDDVMQGRNNGNTPADQESFAGAKGNDTIDGGGGYDEVFYTYKSPTTGVVVNLATGIAQDGFGTIDTLRNIEGVEGSDLNDSITGSSADNRIDGRLGDDTMDGGAGTDWLEYNNVEGAVTVNLSTGKASGAAGNDVFTNFENIFGSVHGDTLTGDAGTNILQGNAGDDTLDGGAGRDSAVFNGKYADYTVSTNNSGVTTVKANAGAEGTDTLSSIEKLVFADQTVVLVPNASPTGSVTISGTAKQGQTLTAANTLADADGLGTISYQWRADGVNISGATGTSLALTQEQVGKAITAVASYTDGGGTAESVASIPSAPVISLPVGSTLTGQIYQWKSHTLLSSAEVSLAGLSAPVLPNNAKPLYELKSVDYNSATGEVQVGLWMNLSAGIKNFDVILNNAEGQALGFTATTSLFPAGWAVQSNPDATGGLSLAGFGDVVFTGTAVQLGTITYKSTGETQNTQINFVDGSVGGVTAVVQQQLSPYAATVQPSVQPMHWAL